MQGLVAVCGAGGMLGVRPNLGRVGVKLGILQPVKLLGGNRKGINPQELSHLRQDT